jgi:TonB family protein
MLSNVVSYAVQVSVVLAVGLLTPRLLRLRSPGVSMRYWQLLLLAVLALPLVQPWRAPTPGTVTVEAVGLAMAHSVAEAIPSRLPLPAGSWMLVVLGSVAAVRLLWLAFGLRALRRLRAGARPDHRLSGAVDALEAQLGTEASVLLSPQVRLPITFGWRRPTVLLPERVARLPKSQQVGVLCHELLHVRRRDWVSVLLEQAIRAVLWFHPAVWVLLERIALSREQVIDADVVRITGARRPYLDALWTMARSVDDSAPKPALTLLNRSDLFHRVALLAEEINMSKYRVAATAVVVVACVAVAGAAVATTFPFVKSAAMVSMSVSSGEETSSTKASDEESDPTTFRFDPDGDVTEPKVIHKVNPTYPEEARKARLTGVVVCETVITAAGEISDVKILRTADEVFNQPTIDALKQWKFEPATLEGEPVDVIYILTIKYRLDSGEKKTEAADEKVEQKQE